jgi:cytochrome c556
MDELQRDWMTLWPQEIDDRYPSADSPRRRAAFGRASELAERLGGTIERIPDAITETSLPEADRRSFLLLVRTLTDQIARFRSAADMRDFEALRKSFRSIDATCHSCHQRFRDVAGPL